MSAPRPIRARAALVLGLALALAAGGLPRPAAAQTKADAFAGKIPPVSGQLFQKAGRFEVMPIVGMSLNDAFFTKYSYGLELGYHLTEAWALSLRGTGSYATRSGSAVTCTATAGCTSATEGMLRQVPGRIRGLAALGVAWAPVYGKLNVLAEKVAHFDLALHAGGDLVARDEILSRADADRLAVDGGSPKVRYTPGFHVGLAARLFVAEWLAVRLDIRDLVYAVKVPNAGPGNDWQNQLLSEIGFSFFLPTQNRPQR